jgi:hypothetical protein
MTNIGTYSAVSTNNMDLSLQRLDTDDKKKK